MEPSTAPPRLRLVSDSILREPAKIYAPFDPRETGRLRQYVADVDDLVQSSFFRPGDLKLTLSGNMSGAMQSSIEYPGEEAVRAVVGLFRQIYNHHEPTSYHQIIKLLSRHAKELGSPHRDAAIAELKGLLNWEKQALIPEVELKLQRTAQDGTVVFEEDYTPKVLIDLFLHGKYLHKGNEKSDRLAAWPMANMLQWSFFNAMIKLSQVYWVGANVVREVLKMPGLLDVTQAA